MPPRIAMPEPVSDRADYNQRALPQYIQAVQEAGGEVCIIPLGSSPEEAARAVPRAHKIKVAPLSRLAAILNSGGATSSPMVAGGLVTDVNSSHHQSAAVVGEGLRAVATCPEDDVIEAIEGTAPDHFVLAVQWHPERTTDTEESSRAIFRAFIQAAGERR